MNGRLPAENTVVEYKLELILIWISNLAYCDIYF